MCNRTFLTSESSPLHFKQIYVYSTICVGLHLHSNSNPSQWQKLYSRSCILAMGFFLTSVPVVWCLHFALYFLHNIFFSSLLLNISIMKFSQWGNPLFKSMFPSNGTRNVTTLALSPPYLDYRSVSSLTYISNFSILNTIQSKRQFHGKVLHFHCLFPDEEAGISYWSIQLYDKFQTTGRTVPGSICGIHGMRVFPAPTLNKKMGQLITHSWIRWSFEDECDGNHPSLSTSIWRINKNTH